MTEDAPQRTHSLREVFNGLRWLVRAGATWRLIPHDLPPWEIVDQQTQRWLRAGVFEAIVHDLRELLRVAAGRKPQPMAAIFDSRTLQSTPESGARAAQQAETHGIRLEVIKVEEAKRGFVLLPRRWVVERSFAWAARFRRLARDYERLPETLAGLHYLAFVILMLKRVVDAALQSS